MVEKIVNENDIIHCNRCDEPFEASKQMTRDGFCGQKSTRIKDFCTCLHCGQTDCHWVFASDIMPIFEGGFEKRRRAERKWLRVN